MGVGLNWDGERIVWPDHFFPRVVTMNYEPGSWLRAGRPNLGTRAVIDNATFCGKTLANGGAMPCCVCMLYTVFLPSSHHLPSDGVFAAEVGEGHDASQLRRLVIHRGQLYQRRQRPAVAKLLSALLLLVVSHGKRTRIKTK